MSKGFNLNFYIWAKITEEGWLVHDAYWKDFMDSLPGTVTSDFTSMRRLENRDGWQKFQLHDFMHIFGNAVVLGKKPVTEGNDIYFKEPKE